MLTNINVSSKNSYELLTNILNWGNIMNSNLLLQKEKINLYTIVTEVISFLEPLMSKKDLSVKNLVNKNLHAFADYQMIKTIVRNLLSNAIKFSPENSPITISSQRLENTSRISISDSGIGMSKEQIDKLFVPKVVSASGTDGETGTGFGLYICNEFIKKNNGEIFVESTLNKGSTFIITIPSN